MPHGAIFRIRWLLVSDTKVLPSPSTATSRGDVNWAWAPGDHPGRRVSNPASDPADAILREDPWMDPVVSCSNR